MCVESPEATFLEMPYTKAPPLVLVCYPFHLPLKLLLSDGTNQKPSLTKSFKDPVRDVSDRKHKYYRNNK